MGVQKRNEIKDVTNKMVTIVTHLRGRGMEEDLVRTVIAVYDYETGEKIAEHDSWLDEER